MTYNFSAKRRFSPGDGDSPPIKKMKPLPTPTQLQISPPSPSFTNDNLRYLQCLPFSNWTNQTWDESRTSHTSNHLQISSFHHNGFNLPPTPAASPLSCFGDVYQSPQLGQCYNVNEQQSGLWPRPSNLSVSPTTIGFGAINVPTDSLNNRIRFLPWTQSVFGNKHPFNKQQTQLSNKLVSPAPIYGGSRHAQAFVPCPNVVQLSMQMPSMASYRPAPRPQPFSMLEMQQSYKRAVDFVSKDAQKHELQQFWVFYRCKPESYFTAMFNVTAGEPRMLLSLKDNTGHERSPLNGALSGVFFMCRLFGRGGTRTQLPEKSIYGDHRVTVDCLCLLLPVLHRLYFADFYCFKHKHYVLLVSARIGSPADHFCYKHLPLLNMKCNPFLTVDCDVNTGLYYAKAEHDKVLVELFYTEEVPFRLCGPVHRIAPYPPTNYYKIKNNKLCTVCNAPSTSTQAQTHSSELGG